MSNKEKILAAIGKHRVCDDCLSEITGITPRQRINIACRELFSSRKISRMTEPCSRCRRAKLVNSLKDKPITSSGAPAAASARPVIATRDPRPWFWEGNVQQKIVEYLSANGSSIQRAANTASREQGKDIVARLSDGRQLWVTVKGYPENSAYVQARHWFAGALHDLARYKDEDGDVALAMGLPQGFATYEGLLKRVARVRKFLQFSVFWVSPEGSVAEDRPD